jgi:hypothetical protein
MQMDHFEIIQRISAGGTLEIMNQTKENPLAAAYLDGNPVSVSQAARAASSPLVKKISGCSEWSAYRAA